MILYFTYGVLKGGNMFGETVVVLEVSGTINAYQVDG